MQTEQKLEIIENVYGVTKEDYRKSKWLQYLVETDEDFINVERIHSIATKDGMETLRYVFRTLQILDDKKNWADVMSEDDIYIIRQVLQWSEVAKGGTFSQRKEWERKGYPLGVHNIASSMIFEEESQCPPSFKKTIKILIQTHGLMGQSLRGETPESSSSDISRIQMPEERLTAILFLLNRCIIEAVSEELWQKVSETIREMSIRFARGDFKKDNAMERLCNMFPSISGDEDIVRLLLPERIKNKEFWYPSIALSGYQNKDLKKILHIVLQKAHAVSARRISFQPMVEFLYYDYEGRKKRNVYKQRVIENMLEYGESKHLSFKFWKQRDLLLVGFTMAPACEKLIDFCVEAERSGVLEYEKSIAMIFDLFHFRRDAFDRLNNEEKYVNAMNASAENSTKKRILNFVKGENVLDVGSGGGVMLEMLTSEYPAKRIIGTDISQNILELLERKKAAGEVHYSELYKHNFVSHAFPYMKLDTIIFSSILHEIFSYTMDINGKPFQIESVKRALINARDSLSDNGRIIIRDGVRLADREKNVVVVLRFSDPREMEKLKMFMNDFKGLSEKEKFVVIKNETDALINFDYAREFLYTYTWGEESYAHEVQEQFGYFTLQEMKDFAKSIGMKILYAKSYLENGYHEHLINKVRVYSMDGEPLEYPDSTMFFVMEK